LAFHSPPLDLELGGFFHGLAFGLASRNGTVSSHARFRRRGRGGPGSGL
ncbi:unnamed protein product, partial [Urochloa humidicola]